MISRRWILSAKINNSSTMASWLPIVSKWNRSDMSPSNRTMFEKSSRRKRLTHSRISNTFTEWITRQISSPYCLLQRDLTDDQSNNASMFLNGMNSKKNVTRRWCKERNPFLDETSRFQSNLCWNRENLTDDRNQSAAGGILPQLGSISKLICADGSLPSQKPSKHNIETQSMFSSCERNDPLTGEDYCFEGDAIRSTDQLSNILDIKLWVTSYCIEGEFHKIIPCYLQRSFRTGLDLFIITWF